MKAKSTAIPWDNPNRPSKLNIDEIQDMKLSDVIRILHAQGKTLEIRSEKIQQ